MSVPRKPGQGVGAVKLKTRLFGRVIGAGVGAWIASCSETPSGPLPPGEVASVTVSPDTASGVFQIELTANTLNSAGDTLTGRPVTWTNSDTTVAKIAYVLSATSPSGVIVQ